MNDFIYNIFSSSGVAIFDIPENQINLYLDVCSKLPDFFPCRVALYKKQGNYNDLWTVEYYDENGELFKKDLKHAFGTLQ